MNFEDLLLTMCRLTELEYQAGSPKYSLRAPIGWIMHGQFRCPNGHVTQASKARSGAGLCNECDLPLLYTFPEDEPGPFNIKLHPLHPYLPRVQRCIFIVSHAFLNNYDLTILGTGVSVWRVYKMWLDNKTDKEVLESFPRLTQDHLLAARRFIIKKQSDIVADAANSGVVLGISE